MLCISSFVFIAFASLSTNPNSDPLRTALLMPARIRQRGLCPGKRTELSAAWAMMREGSTHKRGLFRLLIVRTLEDFTRVQQRQQKKFWQLLRIGGMKTKPKRKRKPSFLLCLSFTSTNCQSWVIQERRSNVGNADGNDVGRTTRACSRAGVVDYFIDLFAPCWPVLHGSLSCSLLVRTAQMRRRHLAAVPELAIALLFVVELAGFHNVYKRVISVRDGALEGNKPLDRTNTIVYPSVAL